MRETLENLSKTTYKPRFQTDFEDLDETVKTSVAEAVEELVSDYLTDPWHHPNVKYIEAEGSVWRLKVGNRGQKVDHRIFFDINDNGLVFLSVSHRDTAYK
ncbi:type II toxin-antitoxin system RelE/ParE family toxin [Saliphagus sp. GCM10025334]